MARILVTGGNGFLGSRVVQLLRQRGDEVHAPRSRQYDLTVPLDTHRCFIDTRPEAVIHLAAEVGGIGANQRNPGRFFYANLQMGLNVLEACRRMGHRDETPKLVVTGTVCAYPKHTPTPFHEDYLWHGYPEETNAPYGIAKRALLTGLHAYREQYGLNGVYLLPANLYGPGDNFDHRSSHVIPALIRKMLSAREETYMWESGALSSHPSVELWGDGTASREFLYVDDCAEAIVAALDRYNDPEPVNLGTGREVTIAELAGMIQQACGYEGRIVWDRSMPNGQPRRCLDTSKAQERFGWRARTSLEDGIARTVEWARENVSLFVRPGA